MTWTKKTFNFLKTLESFFKRKSFQNIFFLSLAFFLLIGFVLNAYASENQGHDVQEVYREWDAFGSTSTGADGKHSYKAQGNQIIDGLAVTSDIICPQCNSRYEEIAADPNISPASKMGLLGITDVALTTALHNPPYIDIPDHLAQQWVPNYDQYQTSVYADAESSKGYRMLQDNNVSGLWEITRNMAYIMFVLVFIIAGFMIMFRHKLGGQTMVTIYNTLPNIIIGLVLVTFSFAIVGIILDIGVVLIDILAGLFDIRLTLGGDRVDPSGFGGFSMWSSMSFELTKYKGILGFIVSTAVMIALFPVAGPVAGVIYLGLKLAFQIVLLIACIKVFITILKAYLGILIDTVMGPIVLALATIPGKQGLTKDWFNRLFKNVLTFVLVFLLVNLPVFFMQQGYRFNIFRNAFFKEGDVSGSKDLMDWNLMAGWIMMTVTIYFLFLAANVPKLLDEYFPQSKGMANASQGISQALSKIPGVGGAFK